MKQEEYFLVPRDKLEHEQNFLIQEVCCVNERFLNIFCKTGIPERIDYEVKSNQAIVETKSGEILLGVYNFITQKWYGYVDNEIIDVSRWHILEDLPPLQKGK